VNPITAFNGVCVPHLYFSVLVLMGSRLAFNGVRVPHLYFSVLVLMGSRFVFNGVGVPPPKNKHEEHVLH
jgi:hypothetical protein